MQLSDTMTDTETVKSSDNPQHRKIKSFVLRAGRMTTGQQKGWDVIFPRQGLKLEDGRLELNASFGRKAPLVVEIGFGMGLSLVEMAGNEPDKNFIGIEVHRPGVGSLMNEADKAGLTNLRAYCDDAIEVLSRCIPDNSIDRLQIYFPDPWHKKRHNKRRLVQPEFVASLLPKMKQGGILHLATDWENYAEQMMEVMTAADGWRNTMGYDSDTGKCCEEYAPRPDYRPITKFEKRGERLGHGVWDMLFKKL